MASIRLRARSFVIEWDMWLRTVPGASFSRLAILGGGDGTGTVVLRRAVARRLRRAIDLRRCCGSLNSIVTAPGVLPNDDQSDDREIS
jgi:hypothetical protein